MSLRIRANEGSIYGQLKSVQVYFEKKDGANQTQTLTIRSVCNEGVDHDRITFIKPLQTEKVAEFIDSIYSDLVEYGYFDFVKLRQSVNNELKNKSG